MRHWSILAWRNWHSRRIRTLGAVLAIALGVGAVVWVTCCYESVRQTVMQWAATYIGASHINVESPLGKYNQIPQRLTGGIDRLSEVEVAVPLLVLRMPAQPAPRAELDADRRYDRWSAPSLDFHGIDLAKEPRVRDYQITAGRMLTPQDRYACVLEEAFAVENGVGVGDGLVVWDESGGKPYTLEIVGLMYRRRIARFQKGLTLVRLSVLQHVALKHQLITSVDVVLKDPSPKNVITATRKIRALVRGKGITANVRNATARMRQVSQAQQQQEIVLVLMSSVAMLTALFIILSTLSMGMNERIGQLGLLRCIGMTRWQLARLVLYEVLPLGAIGIAAGIPIGLALAALTGWLVPEYVGSFAISWTGIALATGAGLATTLVAALLPASAATAVSPLEAAHPQARRARFSVVVITFLVGLALLAAQVYVVEFRVRRDHEFLGWSAMSVVLLYLVYALLAPLVVALLSAPAVAIAARLLGIRYRLLQDQVGHAVWRSAGIACGLMVGLSLIVGLIVFNESFRRGWQFPKEFPEAYLWSFEQMRGDAADVIADVPGIREAAVANAINVIVEERPVFLEQVYLSVTWFLGCDPDSFLDLVRLEFIEGEEQRARELLREGGHVIVAVDFARTRNKHVGDEVRVWFGDHGWRTFRVAGVIDSPALDIAAGYFQAQSEMRVVAVGSVIGNNEDLKRYFNIDGTKLVLLNFDLPPAEPPVDWPPPRGTRASFGIPSRCYDETMPVAARWQSYRETLVLRQIKDELDAPQAFYGTARELKEEIDRELGTITQLLSAVPAVALLVAAIGVANLMTANVISRSKQIAILRAVGATRGQILRMVIGEALVLGAAGSGLGLALGIHLAWNTTTMTIRMWGFSAPLEVPWGFVAGAIGMTVGLCVLAGILPARHAARTNVIDALHVA